MTLIFNAVRAKVITHAHTKTQVQRLVVSKDGVKTNKQTNKQTNGRTDGRTDATDCFTFPADAVGNYPAR